MDQILWIIVALLGLGLVIGYFIQTGDSRKIAAILDRQARQRNGALKPGSLISYPHLIFPHGDTEIQVSVLGGTASVTWAGFLFELPDRFFRIRTTTTGQRAKKALGLAQLSPTGDPSFDRRFSIETNDGPFTHHFLNDPLRAQLLRLDGAYGKHGLLLSLEQNRCQLSIDTFGREEAIFSDLIETAIMCYNRLEASRP